MRGQGIVEKARGHRPEAFEDPRRLFQRADIDAVVAAVPCDLHESIGCEAVRAGKHLYAEKPLAFTLAGCDRLAAVAAAATGASRPRGVPAAIEPPLLGRRDARSRRASSARCWRPAPPGRAATGRSPAMAAGSAGAIAQEISWSSRPCTSGTSCTGCTASCPQSATGWGRTGLFARHDPSRDVTDHYSVELEWRDGFRASFLQSWITPADDGFTGSTLRVLGEDGGLDFGTGSLAFRDRQRTRQTIHPGPQNDTRLSLSAFLASIRAEQPLPPPITLAEARAATLMGLLVRKAVDERRVVTLEEVRAEAEEA